MRKLIVAFAFMVITLTSYAQSGSEHLTFKGIPIEGSMTEFCQKLKKAKDLHLLAEKTILHCLWEILLVVMQL